MAQGLVLFCVVLCNRQRSHVVHFKESLPVEWRGGKVLRNPRLTFINADSGRRRGAPSPPGCTDRTYNTDRTSALLALKSPDHSASRARGGPGCSAALGEESAPLEAPEQEEAAPPQGLRQPVSPTHPVPRPRTGEESARCFCGCLILFLPQPSSLTSRNQGAENSESRCAPACQLGWGIAEGGFLWNGGVAVLPVIPVLTSYLPGFPGKQGHVLKKDYLGRIRKTLGKTQES